MPRVKAVLLLCVHMRVADIPGGCVQASFMVLSRVTLVTHATLNVVRVRDTGE